MTKVYRSVGAVAVYSPWRAAGVVGAAAIVLGGAGFAVGMAAGDDSAPGGTRTVTRMNTVVHNVPAAASTSKPAAKRAPRRTTGGYRRGYRAGAAQVFAGSTDFRAGAVYMVRLRAGAHGALQIGPHVTVAAGATYYLCAGGQRLCMKPGAQG